MPAFAAYNTRVVISGSNLKANSVTVSWHADMLEVTHFTPEDDTTPRTPGYGDYIEGVIDAEVTLDAHWFSEDNPYSLFPLRPGFLVSNVTVYLSKDATSAAFKTFVFPYMLVESIEHMQQVRDTIHFTARLKNRGKVIAYPV